MKRIDLNVDLAEGFPFDRELLKFATSANLCCGEHAGSRAVTQETAAYCREAGVRIGAHPGYPDRANMGRATVTDVTQIDFMNGIFSQMKWFQQTIKATYIKPHGAFYNDTAVVLPEDWQTRARKSWTASPYETSGVYLATVPGLQSLAMLLKVHRLPLLGLPGTAHSVIAERSGQTFIREGFADRRYNSDGTLVSRTEPNSLLRNESEVREQVVRLAAKVDSICLHGDTPDCVAYAEAIVATLRQAGYEVGV